MSNLETMYGSLKGAVYNAAYSNGYPREIRLECENRIRTNYGVWVPRYSQKNNSRHFESDIMFYDNGSLKYIAFQYKTLLDTVYGTMPCMSAMFYEDGVLKHIFAEDMRLVSGLGRDVERTLNDDIRLHLYTGELKAGITGISFFNSGKVCNVSFSPDEVVNFNFGRETVKVRNGVYFHENGLIKSVEPAVPVYVDTPIGELTSIIPDVEYNCGKNNSLEFTPDGEVKRIKTTANIITATRKGEEYVFKPCHSQNSYFSELSDNIPLEIIFNDEVITIIEDENQYELLLEDYVFEVYSAK